MRHKFGWDLPPGIINRMIEEQAGAFEEEEMKTYKIACVWQMWGVCIVRAKSLKEAEEKVLDDLPLPEGYYIDDSIQLDRESTHYGEEK